MIRSFAFSTALHIIMLIMAVVGLPSMTKDLSKQDFALVVDIVTVSDLNNIKVSSKKNEKKSDQKNIIKDEIKNIEVNDNKKDKNPNISKKQTDSAKEVIKQEEKKTVPEIREKISSSQAVSSDLVVSKDDIKLKEEEKKSSKKIEEDSNALPDKKNKTLDNNNVKKLENEKPKEETKKQEIIKTKEIENKSIDKIQKKVEDKKPKEVKEIKKQKEDNEFANSILKSLKEGSKVQKAEKEKKIEKKDLNEIIDDAIQGYTNTEYNSDLPLSISEISAIKSQIERSWNASSFSGGNENFKMKVTIKISLDKNGNITSIKPINQSNTNNAIYRAFVDSAMRAVHDASPFTNLPTEKYNSWEELEFDFDSSGMIY